MANPVYLHQLQAKTLLKFGIYGSRTYSGDHTLAEQNSSEQLQDAPTIYISNRHTRKYKSRYVKLECVGRYILVYLLEAEMFKYLAASPKSFDQPAFTQIGPKI